MLLRFAFPGRRETLRFFFFFFRLTFSVPGVHYDFELYRKTNSKEM